MKKEHIHSYCCLVFSMGKYRVKIGQWQKLHSASNEAMRFAHIQQIFKLCFPQKTQSPKFTDFSNNGAKMDLKNYSKLTAVRCFLLLKILSGRASTTFPGDLFQYYITLTVQIFFQMCKLSFSCCNSNRLFLVLSALNLQKGHLYFFRTKSSNSGQ